MLREAAKLAVGGGKSGEVEGRNRVKLADLLARPRCGIAPEKQRKLFCINSLRLSGRGRLAVGTLFAFSRSPERQMRAFALSRLMPKLHRTAAHR